APGTGREPSDADRADRTAEVRPARARHLDLRQRGRVEGALGRRNRRARARGPFGAPSLSTALTWGAPLRLMRPIILYIGDADGGLELRQPLGVRGGGRAGSRRPHSGLAGGQLP